MYYEYFEANTNKYNLICRFVSIVTLVKFNICALWS